MESKNSPTKKEQLVTQRLISVLVIIASIAALKAASSVLLPIVFAVFLIAVFWPVHLRLKKYLSNGLSAFFTLIVFLFLVFLFVYAIIFSSDLIREEWQNYRSVLTTYYNDIKSYLAGYGITLTSNGADSNSYFFTAANQIFSFTGAFVLILGYLGLGLLEVKYFREKLSQILPTKYREKWFASFHEVSHDFQKYVLVRTAIGLLTGILVWIACLAVGLDFAFAWGFINFLLNYIPTVGSIIAVIPTVLFALIQFQDWGMMLLVLGIIGGIQIIMGTYIDPLLQGKYLKLSPLVVLISVTFWGWVWGIAGAFISVPLTVFIVIICNQFERTKWISTLLAEINETKKS